MAIVRVFDDLKAVEKQPPKIEDVNTTAINLHVYFIKKANTFNVVFLTERHCDLFHCATLILLKIFQKDKWIAELST
ncbi:hypothetical protein G5O_0630 [Chlamydia psittaci 6BC]|nr:hypothetical protein G5O_0630 [Chlamydia psittaci 6BC]